MGKWGRGLDPHSAVKEGDCTRKFARGKTQIDAWGVRSCKTASERLAPHVRLCTQSCRVISARRSKLRFQTPVVMSCAFFLRFLSLSFTEVQKRPSKNNDETAAFPKIMDMNAM